MVKIVYHSKLCRRICTSSFLFQYLVRDQGLSSLVTCHYGSMQDCILDHSAILGFIHGNLSTWHSAPRHWQLGTWQLGHLSHGHGEVKLYSIKSEIPSLGSTVLSKISCTCYQPDQVNQQLFWIKLFFDLNFFGRNIFCPKYFWTQNFILDTNCFWTQNFFGPKFLFKSLYPIPDLQILDKKNFGQKIFFGQKNVFGQKNFWSKKFWSEKFFDPKKIQAQKNFQVLIF